MADFTRPSLVWGPRSGSPSEFLDETYPEKLEGWGYCMVKIAWSVFDWSTRVTDIQTDRQTELPWHIRAIAYMLSRVKMRWSDRYVMLRWKTEFQDESRERVGIGDIISVLQENRLRWYGHLLRKEDNDWVKKCMEYEREGARPSGRPKRTWREVK